MANFLKQVLISYEDYIALQQTLESDTFYLFSNPGTYYGAINGLLLSPSGGGGSLNQTFLTTTNEIATLPNSTSLAQFAGLGEKFIVLASSNGTTATMSAFILNAAPGILQNTTLGVLSSDFSIVTDDSPFSVNSGVGLLSLDGDQITLTSGSNPLLLTSFSSNVSMASGTSNILVDRLSGNTLTGVTTVEGDFYVPTHNCYLGSSVSNYISINTSGGGANTIDVRSHAFTVEGVGNENPITLRSTGGAEAFITLKRTAGATGIITFQSNAITGATDSYYLACNTTWEVQASTYISLNSPTVRMPSINIGAGTALVINGGTVFIDVSARKYKENIIPIELDSSGIYNLQPVSFTYKGSGLPSMGYISDDTPSSLDALVVRNEVGEVESFSYDRLSVFLVEEIKRLNQRLTALENK